MLFRSHRAAPATGLAPGKLTNLAVLMQQHPELAPCTGRQVWMGGSAGPGNPNAAAEFNAAVDPEAINVVTTPGVPLQRVGLNA